MPRFTRLLAAALSGIVILGLCVATAEARGVPRVSGVVKAGQLAHRGLVKITWHGVRGARYQMRVAAAPRRLPAARGRHENHERHQSRKRSRHRAIIRSLAELRT